MRRDPHDQRERSTRRSRRGASGAPLAARRRALDRAEPRHDRRARLDHRDADPASASSPAAGSTGISARGSSGRLGLLVAGPRRRLHRSPGRGCIANDAALAARSRHSPRPVAAAGIVFGSFISRRCGERVGSRARERGWAAPLALTLGAASPARSPFSCLAAQFGRRRAARGLSRASCAARHRRCARARRPG